MEFCGHETGDEAGEAGEEWVSIGYVEGPRVGVNVKGLKLTDQARRAMPSKSLVSAVWVSGSDVSAAQLLLRYMGQHLPLHRRRVRR